MKDYAPDHTETSTTKKVWWALQYPDGSFHGEKNNQGGFALALFTSKDSAESSALQLVKDTPNYQRAFPIEICIAQALGKFR
jgi:hypothetical protein